jgi:hypothetical protein
MKKTTQIALVAIALAAAADASANVPTQTETFTSNTLAFTKSNSGVLDLTKFNTALGTLQSVQIQLFSDLNTTIKVENKSVNSTSMITGTAGVGLTLTGATLSQTLSTSGQHIFSEAKFDGDDHFSGTSGGSYTFALAPFSGSSTYSDAATLSAFSGNGQVQLNLAGLTSSNVTGTSGNTHSLVLPSYDAYAKVTYTYAVPVPEPETYAMLLAGLGLVGVIARKRKAK